MNEKNDPVNTGESHRAKEENVFLMGYTAYPAGEDIYHQSKEEENIDPEDTSKVKEPNEETLLEKDNEKDFEDDVSGSDLDVPGSDLDDKEEAIGSEDEENNLYSTGGDNHNELEENKGE